MFHVVKLSKALTKCSSVCLVKFVYTVVCFFQAERKSPQHHYRPRPTMYGTKMRASVRMTRYLESWGAAKPFANLHHRDSMTNENGKINTSVSLPMRHYKLYNKQ